ncbi:energy-coupling factor transporter transmembrane component T family protein [Sporosarcina highlanderae]|uniref:Energy-coupling factor transporter transmembrane component T n=1 Tax=Sporosarcina highlanderae TaxID=3035916 RepID=A0ABT8JS49_9BACL|nr:energy-coupling factor transporter transmembrane component T [Sporosarcina highlanderae]MDN4607986.1 energy-coupling factor transporter transmembrane component T [Sporosarcina highlanderae]
MTNMTLYVKKDSPVHSVDPLTKLLFAFYSITLTYIVSSHLSVLLILLSTLIILLAGKVFKYILPVIGVSFLLILSIIIVQGFFHPTRATVLFEVGPISIYKEGFLIAFLIALRVINMVAAFGVLILTTKPDDLVDSLLRKGLSPRFGYVLLSVLQIIPQMASLTGKITDAQRARGMETEGGLWMRFKSFIPLLGPVVLNSLSETRERSIALEIRGFNAKGQRTFIRETEFYQYGLFLKILMTVIFIAVVVWRFVS